MTKILIIEDDFTIRKKVQKILSKLEGFEFLEATDGKTGLDMFQTNQPDLILCDILMPEMDGYEVLKQVRSLSTGSLTPFIFLSGKAERQDIREGMDLGADDYLIKPFQSQELMSSILKRLERKNQIEKLSEKELEELRGNIIYSLPHELYTPLNGILGFTDFLMENVQTLDSDEIRNMLLEIRSSAKNLQNLFSKYLSYAQIELTLGNQAKLKEIRGICDENALEHISMTASVRAVFYQREDDLKLNLTSDEAKVRISEENLKKITEELVDNAFKFSEPKTKVSVQSSITDQLFSFSVTNQGRGMDEQQINQIGAYMQFDRKIYEQQGSGFGLVTVKKLLEIHRGSFSIKSVPEGETITTVNLKVVS